MTPYTLLHRVQHGLSRLELIYSSHDAWPLPRHSPVRRPVTVLVLDSSFNPPTLAHLALANTRPPHVPDYDAKLLLLSVRNADKSIKPQDASYLQRLEMMSLLAQDVLPKGEALNVAVAIIDEPRFVDKSACLQSFFKARFRALGAARPGTTTHDTQLTFCLGLDTLERLVQPHYYSSQSRMIESLRKFLSPGPDGDDSYIVCARRVPSKSPSHQTSDSSLTLAPVQEFIASGRITLIDIDEDLRSHSSSEVRDILARLGIDSSGWKKLVTARVADYIASEKLYF